MCSSARNVSERGSGTFLALGLVMALVAATLLLVTLVSRTINQVKLNALADSAAVAAADALRGLVAGYPCEVAKQFAPVTSCEVKGNDVLVEVSDSGLTARARAGEPG